MTAPAQREGSVLYISYDGMLEPLGRSQVIAYLMRLASRYRISILSFEKTGDWANVELRERTRRELADAGISWRPLRYHKRPSALATAFDIFQGIAIGSWLTLSHNVRIVHARSYVSSVMALVLKAVFGTKFVFDMRGFWADERVDGGLWPRDGILYRSAKWFERRFLLSADRVVSLTHAAVAEMRTFPYLRHRMPIFDVITTCTDLDLFKRHPAGLDGRPSSTFTLGYVGSVGVWYMFDEVLRCFKYLQDEIPEARLYIVNRGDHAYISSKLKACGIDPSAVYVETTDHAGVVRAMGEMDAGIFFIKPVYSKMASAPTKLGEFLGCGIPCLGNTGVGDMAFVLEGENVGIAMSGFSEQDMRAAVAGLVRLSREEGIHDRCRRVAVGYFSIEAGARQYGRIYNELLGGSSL